MYQILFRATTAALEQLVAAQQACEDIFVEDEEKPPILLERPAADSTEE